MTSITDRNMAVDEPVHRYTRIAMLMHWLVAALIFVNIALGLSAEHVGDDHVRQVVDAHKSIGLTVLGLVVLRILWRIGHKPPPLPPTYPWIERLGAHLAHAALYGIILALPLSGYLHDSAWNAAASHPLVMFGVLPVPRAPLIKALDPATKDVLHTAFGAAHIYIGYALYGLLALHVLGVLKHHLWDREPELSRMLPGRPPTPHDAA